MSDDLKTLVAQEVAKQLATITADQTTKKVLEFLKNRNSADAYVVEVGGDSTSWYRVWSDGFIEQGGVTSQAGSAGSTVSFHEPFKDSNYSFVATPLQFSASRCYVCYSKDTKTASSINVVVMNRLGEFDATDIDWYACGY